MDKADHQPSSCRRILSLPTLIFSKSTGVMMNYQSKHWHIFFRLSSICIKFDPPKKKWVPFEWPFGFIYGILVKDRIPNILKNSAARRPKPRTVAPTSSWSRIESKVPLGKWQLSVRFCFSKKLTFSSWWGFPQPIWKIWGQVKLDQFPQKIRVKIPNNLWSFSNPAIVFAGKKPGDSGRSQAYVHQ